MNIKTKLIEKLYQGACTKADLILLFDLLEQSSDLQNEEFMEQLWQESQKFPDLFIVPSDKILSRTLQKIQEQEATSAKVISLPKNRNLFLRIASAAAILLLGIFAYFQLQTVPNELLVLTTSYGEQKELVLPDQSLVILNANSSIKYAEEWASQEDRRVWLTGEAYFEVEKKQQTGQKFQVIADDLTVEVLGTIFNVNSRSASTDVFLKEGKVNLKFQDNTEELAMQAGDLVSYSKTDKTTSVQQVKEEEEEKPTSWKDGTIAFQDHQLKDILSKLEELYGVKIKVEAADQLERSFTIDLPINDFDTAFLILKELTQLNLRVKEEKE
ncbi:MAG: FecR family protein [Bacteroidota bacterium]